jgi:hypothetical protein
VTVHLNDRPTPAVAIDLWQLAHDACSHLWPDSGARGPKSTSDASQLVIARTNCRKIHLLNAEWKSTF